MKESAGSIGQARGGIRGRGVVKKRSEKVRQLLDRRTGMGESELRRTAAKSKFGREGGQGSGTTCPSHDFSRPLRKGVTVAHGCELQSNECF